MGRYGRLSFVRRALLFSRILLEAIHDSAHILRCIRRSNVALIHANLKYVEYAFGHERTTRSMVFCRLVVWSFGRLGVCLHCVRSGIGNTE